MKRYFKEERITINVQKVDAGFERIIEHKVISGIEEALKNMSSELKKSGMDIYSRNDLLKKKAEELKSRIDRIVDAQVVYIQSIG